MLSHNSSSTATSEENPVRVEGQLSSPDVVQQESTSSATTTDKEFREMERAWARESRLLGEYTERTEIERGEFGVIFKARHKIEKEWYAIKQVDPFDPVDPFDMDDTEQSPNKVPRELHILAKLDHPHIVRYYDAWLEKPPPGEELPRMDRNQPCLYIRMELCCGPTLHKWLGQNRLPEQRPISQTLDWFRQLVLAVKYIHDKKVIHRDIKPENIFFGSSHNGTAPVLKIGGFGLAIDVAALPPAVDEIDEIYPFVGTDSYMSPEQPSGRYKNSTDIFSLGLVFLEMGYPFETDRERRSAFGALRSSKRPKVMNSLDKKMDALISWMTAFEPKKRPTASELNNELKKKAVKHSFESAKEIGVGPHAKTNDGTGSNVKSEVSTSSTHPNESVCDNEATAEARAEVTPCVGDLEPSTDSATDVQKPYSSLGSSDLSDRTQ